MYTGPLGIGFLDYRTGLALLVHLEGVWNRQKIRSLPRAVKREPLLQKLRMGARSGSIVARATYVVASHSGLCKVPGALRKIDPKGIMHRLVYIHDLIPIEMPEYQRPSTRLEFISFLKEITGAPLSIASNSKDTDKRVRKLAEVEKWPVEAFYIHMPTLERIFGITRSPRDRVVDYLADSRPYFAVIGTIEPRKNHLLLLNLWRRFSSTISAVPRLCIIGKRGWENENIVDMLDRCDAIKSFVTEFDDLNDFEVQLLISSARAMLFPSFIEGLGIPMLEATKLNVPCIVSDIDVFREVAGVNTTFVDPLDGLGWRDAILSRL
ncbi:glycosyltransferase [Agrobacterium rosae]|uniref:glycosyltransferase n=1 Tax=Agrobacterium rosae TaxID=1972867 RepID=UPI003B9E7D41